jgi:HAD superfamily hydrolase (TIGR01493 family)
MEITGHAYQLIFTMHLQSKRHKMEWDMFFASDLLQGYKPAPEVYRMTMKVLRLEPNECVMVAAHAYDLKAAADL